MRIQHAALVALVLVTACDGSGDASDDAASVGSSSSSDGGEPVLSDDDAGGNNEECPSDISLLPTAEDFVALANGAVPGMGEACSMARSLYESGDTSISQTYADCIVVTLRDLIDDEESYCWRGDRLCRVMLGGYGNRDLSRDELLFERTGAPTTPERALQLDVESCVLAGDFPQCDYERIAPIVEWASTIECNETECERRHRLDLELTPLCD